VNHAYLRLRQQYQKCARARRSWPCLDRQRPSSAFVARQGQRQRDRGLDRKAGRLSAGSVPVSRACNGARADRRRTVDPEKRWRNTATCSRNMPPAQAMQVWSLILLTTFRCIHACTRTHRSLPLRWPTSSRRRGCMSPMKARSPSPAITKRQLLAACLSSSAAAKTARSMCC
jgi:hypothetical protein